MLYSLGQDQDDDGGEETDECLTKGDYNLRALYADALARNAKEVKEWEEEEAARLEEEKEWEEWEEEFDEMNDEDFEGSDDGLVAEEERTTD